jgi:hypothetical protein
MIVGEKLETFIDDLFSGVFRPRPKESVATWARENVYLSQEVSPEFPGYFDLETSPCADVLFEFYESTDYDEFIGCKSSQIGFSLAAQVCLLHYVSYVGKNVIVLLDSAQEAIRINRTRLQPMLRHCRPLANLLDDSADSLNNLTLYLRGLAVFLMGSFSPSSMANKTAGLGICDEVDNYPAAPKGESNGLDLVRDRLKKVVGSKLFAFSKPKDETDIIWREYLTGSRHRCFVPCPHCTEKKGKLSGFQTIEMEQLKFDHCKNVLDEWDYQRVLGETYLECKHCGEAIDETSKPWMIANRSWRATNKGEDRHKPKPRKMSVQISDLYSLFPKDTWGALALEWLDAQGSTSKIKKFRRSRLGLPAREQRIELSTSDIVRMSGAYGRGELPQPVDVVLMAADVQKDLQKWVTCGFRLEDDAAFVIDYGETLTFSRLLEIADEPIKVLDWKDTPEDLRSDPIVYKGLIDEGDGNRQKDIRDFILTTFVGMLGNGMPDYRFYSCFGRGGIQTNHWKDTVETLRPIHQQWPILVYKFNDWSFKEDLYLQRIGRFGEIEKAKQQKKPLPPVPRLYFPQGISEPFAKEFTTEKKVWDDKKKRWIWATPTGPNDYPDALKMCFVAWYVLRPILLAQRAAEAGPPGEVEAED